MIIISTNSTILKLMGCIKGRGTTIYARIISMIFSIDARDYGGTTIMLLPCKAFSPIDWARGQLEVISLILLM